MSLTVEQLAQEALVFHTIQQVSAAAATVAKKGKKTKDEVSDQYLSKYTE